VRMAARLRELIGSWKKEFAPREITLRLGFKNGVGVRNVLTNMVERGEVERTGYGRYRFLGFLPKWSERAEVKPRIHRAMHVKRSFTAAEIARLSDAGVNFVRKELLKLAKQGDLERVCLKQSSRFSREWVYRVRHPDRFYVKYCAGSRRKG